MTYLLGTVAVEDAAEWRSNFTENNSFRTEHGQRGYQAYQSVDDPNEITVIFEWEDGDDPREFFRSPEMRERMEKAGVKGQPKFATLELIDRKEAPGPTA